ncbi:hypothetical protein [Spirosoma pollinicola]|nr:hypothetical protein [Spirosoma pollinicola]
MYRTLSKNALIALLLFLLIGCHDVTLLDRTYQQIRITDFSVPVRTVLPAPRDNPSSMTIRVSGTISHPVSLKVDPLGSSQGLYPIRRDSLAAGSYTNESFRGDFYSTEATELVVTGTPGTTGFLTIEWFCQ